MPHGLSTRERRQPEASTGRGSLIPYGASSTVRFRRSQVLVPNTMRICIIQSCYIPWKGFFDLIGRCEEYVVYDSAQFVKGHWHNRNRIKTAAGTKWLTIPVLTSNRLGQSIRDVEISGKWADQHWSAIEQAYRNAAFFTGYRALVQGWYEQADRTSSLSEVNSIFISGIASQLGIATRMTSDL